MAAGTGGAPALLGIRVAGPALALDNTCGVLSVRRDRPIRDDFDLNAARKSIASVSRWLEFQRPALGAWGLST